MSPQIYLTRNLNRSLPLVGVIILAVMLIFGIVALINSIPLSVRTVYKYSSTMTGITPRGETGLTTKIRDRIEKFSPVPLARIMNIRASETQVRSIVGKWNFAVIAVTPDDMKFALARLDGSKVVGRFPIPGQPEILISEPLARNTGWKLGDVALGPEKENAYSPMNVKVVGISQSKEWFAFADRDYYEANHFPPIDLLLVYAKDPADQPKLDHWAWDEFKGDRARVFVYSEVERESQEMFHTLYTILDVVIGALVTVISILMGMLTNIYLIQRTQEFALLQALGYTKNKLIHRVLKESLIVVMGGWILGIGVGILLLKVVDIVLMQPNAYAIDIFDYAALRYSVPVPIAILSISVLTLWNRFRTFDPIGVVERRLV